MKKLLWMVAVAVGVSLTMAPVESEAKRLGGARSSGMQRSTPDKPVQNNATPAQPAANPNSPAGAAAAAPATAGAAAAAAAPKRSWLGPIAGLAAGLGIAALFSHLGMGEGLANFVMLALLALAAFALIRFLMRRFGGAQQAGSPLAMAGAGAAAAVPHAAPARPQFVDERPGMQRSATGAPAVTIGSALQAPLAVSGLNDGKPAAALALPAGFDVEGFERLAKVLFIRMQAANDGADLNDLRNFTTPELFAALRLDLQDRADAKQHTDVVKVDARLIDFAQEDERQIVSVRYTGLVREAEDAPGAAPSAFDEVWHLVKPQDDNRSWAIAGIQQRA
jgi:predicted lipid-binding transport protein (Tim44 family)